VESAALDPRVYSIVSRRPLRRHARVAVVFEHPPRHMTRDGHHRSIRCARFCHLGYRLMPEIVEA